ncbi:hypothetical protein C8N40_106169 [Pontibacter mucosus]|uniref:Uncharacterized protein n=1 Tax=Pontibacter mucosus TaxID=1649266 RepID=A0A2T5YGD5_9BACT|nr:hypothetical protein [Pontibacter mucosus]PTX18369.1 hypothetical protein C8N40_106169 [Pontibacter mucosus]
MKTSMIAFITALLCFSIAEDALALNPIEKAESMTYKEKLLVAKTSYPFTRWRKSFRHGLKQYTKDNCEKSKQVFDDFIGGLIAIGEHAPKEEKIKLFKTAILSLNDLNNKVPGLIETGEREELCALIDRITVAAGLDPKEFAGGEGIADEWREG